MCLALDFIIIIIKQKKRLEIKPLRYLFSSVLSFASVSAFLSSTIMFVKTNNFALTMATATTISHPPIYYDFQNKINPNT